MTSSRVGTVWSVIGRPDAVVIIAGPFSTPGGRREYLVAPLYSGEEPGFSWTSEDVRLAADETGFGEVRFAAVWNARPMLAADLGIQRGELSLDGITAVLDAYWASLNDKPLGTHPRLGRPVRSPREPAARFQAAELDRWETLSGRVFDAPTEASAIAVFDWKDSAIFVDADLSAAIEASEELVGPASIAGCGPGMVWIVGGVSVRGPVPGPPALPDLFAPEAAPVVERGVRVEMAVDEQTVPSDEPAASDLALAA